MVTLTIQHVPTDRLAELLRRLRDGFRLLRRRPFWRRHVRGGVALVEISHGANGWHPHLHVVAVADFIPQGELSTEWRRLTDSHVVDVRAVSSEDVGAYLTKYLTKPAKPAVYRDPDLLAEAIIALKGARMIQTFGCIKAADLGSDDDDDAAADATLTWIPVGRLDYVLTLPPDHPIRQEFARWLTTDRLPP